MTDNVADELSHLLPHHTRVTNTAPAPAMTQPESPLKPSSPGINSTAYTAGQPNSSIGQASQVKDYTDNVTDDSAVEKKGVWTPLIWIICSFVYYFCIEANIINVYTNETYRWIVATAVFFYLGYKVIRSTIKSIKINKWCWAYIPFSIAMAIVNIFLGIASIGFYLDR